MTNYVQKGNTITVTAPYTVLSGGAVLVGSLFGVASNDATSGATDLEIVTEGVFDLAKTSALAITAGDQLYWDDTAKELNKTSTGVAVAVATADAANPSSTVRCRLTSGATPAIAAPLVQSATVSLTNAEIKALRATPKTLVAAPGSTKIVEFVSAILVLHAGANVLSESTANLAVKRTNGSGVQLSQTIEMTGFIDQAVDTITSAESKIDAIEAASAAKNGALVLHNLGAGEFGANAANDATVDVHITYRTHTF